MILHNKVLKKLNIVSDKGMTMVEVLMGFTVLMVLLGGLSSIIMFSSNLYMNSVDIKHSQEAFQAEIYKNNNSALKKEQPIRFAASLSATPTEKEDINTRMHVYSVYSGDILNAITEDKLQMTYYYIGGEGGSNP